MHEFHLMMQVVNAVETGLHGTPDARASVVRLKVSARSHLLAHDGSTLQTAFALATKGTVAEGAKLEIIAIPVTARCHGCGQVITVAERMPRCSSCGSMEVDLDEGPEVVVHEVVVTE
jgi:hydrogenase nickel incorporation protein HypA/HybF